MNTHAGQLTSFNRALAEAWSVSAAGAKFPPLLLPCLLLAADAAAVPASTSSASEAAVAVFFAPEAAVTDPLAAAGCWGFTDCSSSLLPACRRLMASTWGVVAGLRVPSLERRDSTYLQAQCRQSICCTTLACAPFLCGASSWTLLDCTVACQCVDARWPQSHGVVAGLRVPSLERRDSRYLQEQCRQSICCKRLACAPFLCGASSWTFLDCTAPCQLADA